MMAERACCTDRDRTVAFRTMIQSGASPYVSSDMTGSCGTVARRLGGELKPRVFGIIEVLHCNATE